jgi:hypothetical protein
MQRGHEQRATTVLQGLALTSTVICIGVKADGRFPFPADLSEPAFQLLLLPLSMVFTASFAALALAAGAPARWPALGDGLARVQPLRLAAASALLLQVMTAALFVLQARKFASFGYDLDPAMAGAVFGAIAAAWLVVLARPRITWVLLAGLVSYAAVNLLSIASFPLHPERSDMLPLITAANEAFLAGSHPYQVHAVPHPLPLTYLPVTWLSYLPASAAGLDPRWINLLCVLAASALIHRAARDRERSATLLVIFLTSPYLLYRHEIYYGPLWLLLAATFALGARGRVIAAAATAGLAAAASQFAWVVIPFLAAHAVRDRGWRTGLISLATTTLVAAAPLGAFALTAPEDFFDGVFGHWHGTLAASTINLSWFVTRVAPIGSLPLIQGGVLAVTWIVFIRRERSWRTAWAWAAAALLTFVALNPLVWVYFYLTVLWLALMAADRDAVQR